MQVNHQPRHFWLQRVNRPSGFCHSCTRSSPPLPRTKLQRWTAPDTYTTNLAAVPFKTLKGHCCHCWVVTHVNDLITCSVAQNYLITLSVYCSPKHVLPNHPGSHWHCHYDMLALCPIRESLRSADIGAVTTWGVMLLVEQLNKPL